MEPLLPGGSRVVAIAVQPGTRLRVGDVVLARTPDRQALDVVKRIAAVDGDSLVLAGDNVARSTNALVDRRDVIAVIRWRYWPMPVRRL